MGLKIFLISFLFFCSTVHSQTCSDFPEITASSTLVCIGASVNLLASNTNGVASIVDQFTMTFMGPYSHVVNTVIGQVYSMKISGKFDTFCDYPGGKTDAAYWGLHTSSPSPTNFIKWNALFIRPTPDVYQLNHIYNYDNLVSNSTSQNFTFIDNPYADNCGALTFIISTNPSSYLWSTGETTASIIPNPTNTTTYWVDVTTNGLTCRKSITINVGQSIPPTFNPTQSFCSDAFISDIVGIGNNIKWYDTAIGGNLLSPSTALVNGSIYYASQTLNGCESSRIPVTVSINNPSSPTGTATQSFCDSANIADLVVTGVDVKWYSSAVGGIALVSTTPLVNGTNYFASQTINGCNSQARFSVLITINPLITPVFASIPNQLCNNSVAPLLPLVSNNITPIIGTWTPSVVNTSIVGNSNYLFTPNSGQCVSIIPVISTINVIPKRVPNFSDIAFCNGQLSPILSNTSPNGIGGTWTPTTVSNNSSGDYVFLPNASECALPKTIHVNINEATLLSIEYLVSGDFTDNQTVTVIATNPGNYLYQLDSGSFQTSNIFQNVNPGLHSVKVVDVNGCSQNLKLQNVMVINYPRFFSPNGDSYNDYWNIIGLLNSMKPKIFIYDRYGKLVKQIKPYELGWDGMYNGKELPSTDYWFTVEYQGLNGNLKIFKSHFSLIR
jgi:gliding motility-associated-like protein